MFRSTIAVTVVFTLVVAGALLAPLTSAPEPTTWILSMAVMIGVGLARPAKGHGRLPPGIA